MIVPPGYLQPTFAIDHDKGIDTRWYSDLSDGAIVPCDKGKLGHDYELSWARRPSTRRDWTGVRDLS